MNWLEHTVDGAEEGRTVQEIATATLGVSRRMIQRLTRSRGILLNRRPARLGRKVVAGDVIAVRVAKKEEDRSLEPVEMPLSIVHEDDDLLIIDKPASLLVHPVGPRHRRTLAHGVAHHLQQAGLRTKVRPVHRLDRDTSGLVVFAKNEFAHQHLDRQLRERTLRREYLALVAGELRPETGEIRAPIARKRGDPTLREVRSGGDEAVTRYRVLDHLDGMTAVALELETGRTHQIRVHMAHVGHPLVGDRQYGGSTAPGIRRQALHAWKIELTHPRTGETLSFSAPPPADIQGLYNAMK